MNQNAARKLSAAHGGSLSYDVKNRKFTVTRSDGKQFTLGRDTLTAACADDFRRRYLEVPK